MSATLIAVIPLALFGIVALVGFAGCTLNRFGTLPDSGPDIPPTPTPSDPYDDLIKAEGTLVAFWTLTEANGASTAINETVNFNGTYQGGFGITNYDMANQSAAAVGDVTAGQPGIVPGDALNGVQDTCAFFNGGIVFVDYQKAINMPAPFSVEAWVAPDKSWTDATQPALRGVVVSNHTSPYQGFGLFATPDNQWLFSLGMDSKPIGPTAAIDFTQPVHHLVGTFDDKGVCTLFVNGVPAPPIDTAAMGLTYVPVPDTTHLFIGAGLPQQGTSMPPLFPLVGSVQCVAIYSSALDAGTIQKHFSTGMTAGG